MDILNIGKEYVLFICLIFFTSSSIIVGCSHGVPVSFVDEQFADVVRNHLDEIEDKEEISNRDLHEIDKFYIYNTGEKMYSSLVGYVEPGKFVQSIRGIEHMKNLEGLLIYGSLVEDIAPIKDLTSLESVELKATKVEDISSLSYLPNLRTLILEKNKINDLSPLTYLNDLRILILNEKGIKDLSPLLEIESLVYLKVGQDMRKVIDNGNNQSILELLEKKQIEVNYIDEEYDYGF
ncbi:MAG: hypothetical protein ACOCZR_01290 [Halanaerobiales bacterium]